MPVSLISKSTEMFMIFGGEAPACNIAVHQQLAATDRDIADVIDNWKTSGFYTIEQFREILNFGMLVRERAGDALRTAMGQLQIPSQRALLEKSHQTLIEDQRIDPLPFIRGMNEAINAGIEVIESKGFRRYVISVLQAARMAKGDVMFVECMRPSSLLGVIGALGSAIDKFIQVVKTTVTAIADAAVALGKAVLKIPDLLSTFFTILKWIPAVLLLGGGYYVATKTILPPKYDPLRLRDRETFAPWRRKSA